MPTRITTTYCLLLIAALGAFALSLANGSVGLSPGQLWHGLMGEDSLARAVVLELRLPRTLTAFAAGGLLAIAGVLMQVLLRNPLADPFVMGISGGAAVAALSAMLVGLTGLLVDVSATLGALATTLIVFALARGEGGWTPTRLLLTGIVMAAGAGAVVSVLLAMGNDTELRGMLFWLMGDLSTSSNPWPLLVLFAIAVVVLFPLARHLNVLSRGELQAQMLGAPVRAMRIAIFIASSILTAATVTSAGTIGFVGLVTPHLVRLMLGADHRLVLPAAALLGGTLVMIADLCARTLFAPRQLPVGALTAIAGVPLFLILMRRGKTVP
ncbi:iron complex transport system permease protein [Povalibacter uvarum]|uniref:Iron complex transport system permease protein n=1 Tax=Povalibacter uvarum TaxID=732238 RepID=A0A841HSB6_9GAMM|nr:iron ABC transporter permease [Povalibacter uvarum]MBB6095663.1 iron complex transport system permease protein [Povalibacter uvarum]